MRARVRRRVKRRAFIALIGGAVICPRSTTAQQHSKVYTIAIFNAAPRNSTPHLEAAFFEALRELGWIEGRNVVFERRYGDNRAERLPELAVELVHLNVDVIVAVGTLETHAAKRATTTIPIVMPVAGDPIAEGLVASLPRPGGNITGMSFMSGAGPQAAAIAQGGSSGTFSTCNSLEPNHPYVSTRYAGNQGGCSDTGN